METYYIRHHSESLGPYSMEELKLIGLLENDFVWKGGLGEWTEARNLQELKDVLICQPSSLMGSPTTISMRAYKNKYSNSIDSVKKLISGFKRLLELLPKK
jgi:hypothetical protein